MDKNELIEMLIKEKGGTREQYLSLLNKVAYHESAHTMDPTIRQQGGGPGRGKYQFEEGKNRGGITAARRTRKYLDSIGKPIPEWLNEATESNSLDATQLNSEQQDILFLGNMRMHPTADFSNYVNGKESTEEFWANYHWAGSDKDRDERLSSFNNSMNKYQSTDYPNYQPQEQVASINQSSSPQPEATVDNTRVAPQMDYSKVEMKQEQSPQYSDNQNNIKLETQPYEDLVSYIQTKGNDFNEINEGGKHEENPNGGVPHGAGNNGQMNTVEQGETSFNFGDEKFIFSDRVSLTDYINKKKTNI